MWNSQKTLKDPKSRGFQVTFEKDQKNVGPLAKYNKQKKSLSLKVGKSSNSLQPYMQKLTTYNTTRRDFGISRAKNIHFLLNNNQTLVWDRVLSSCINSDKIKKSRPIESETLSFEQKNWIESRKERNHLRTFHCRCLKKPRLKMMSFWKTHVRVENYRLRIL